jgi:hypothetical protein
MTQHIATGNGAPVSAPPSIGAHYHDLVTADHYIATGTTAAADWGHPINEPARVITEATAAMTLTAAHRVVHATSPIGDGNMQITLPLVTAGRWQHEIYLGINNAARNIDFIQPFEQVNAAMGGDPSLADGVSTGYIGSNTTRLSQPAFTRWKLILTRAGEAFPWSLQALDVTEFQSVS